ncbi:MAG TPA: DinB family protein [Acidobacteriaceae bacterium]|jgi:uncharacterized damage-inducible protein DinB
MTALTANELMRWNDATAKGLLAVLRKHPEALALPCDVREGSSVADLLQHIVAAELRYAERLHGEMVTEYEDIAKDSAESLYATHDRALETLRALLSDANYPWEEELEFPTRSIAGKLVATRRAIFSHALLHSIRHYAQLATLLRQHGISVGFPMDFLFVTARAA